MDRGLTPAPRRLTPGLWRLGCGHMPSFLIRGRGEAAIFEVGVSASAALVPDQLKALGVPPEEVTRVVVSHSHADHSAGAQVLLAALPAARLAMTEACRRHLAKGSTLERFAGEDAFTSREIARRELGRDWLRQRTVSDLLPGPVETIEPGQAIEVGGVRVEFMAMAGHVPGGLTAWLPGEGALLLSDAGGLSVGGRPFFPLYFVEHAAYLGTIARARALAPAVVAPGHQEHFAGPAVAGFLAGLAESAEACHQRVLAESVRGRRPEEIAAGLFEHYYRGELTVYPPENIRLCCRLLARRSLEAAKAGQAG